MAPKEQENQNDEEILKEESLYHEAISKARKVHSLTSALKEAVSLGFLLKENIKNHRVEVFIIAGVIAGAVDLSDMAFLGIDSLITGWGKFFCILTLFIFLFGKGRWKTKALRWVIIRILFITGFVEFIPFLSMLPMWTISVFYFCYKSKNEAQKNQLELDEILKKTTQLENKIAQL
ncbi:hypothetical protein CVV26_00040 [Candidatus Kuenenbacteria bacterium HGW-Kuenenbacteria-1]|uniref:Uncharacterized protein n=1 Tax=Candidatus Kuenenbacteria bacterium HGW-Kuenenbacteria-1 TaxID=2013812 RepID=A0A2N1UP74_9BACT|nr:MAG: hypothetical protein CVV26_00040 [Candidatus Kuenenbacteria bacterium HGW-Kuenenbacteria-1]